MTPSRLALVLSVILVSAKATAQDFSTFQFDEWPSVNFPAQSWDVTNNGQTVSQSTNAGPAIFYDPESIVAGKIIRFTMFPGNDDDFVGVALGYDAGDDYVLITWKGEDQTYDFVGDPFHQATVGGLAKAGLALSIVSGLPTADELWQLADLPGNATGGVTEIARGNTLGSADYGLGTYQFEIHYSTTNIVVKIDGVEEINVTGTFTEGGWGLYELGQANGMIVNDPFISNADDGKATIALLPDMQVYSDSLPGMNYMQTGWLSENYLQKNILYTLQLGDLTEHNTHEEWIRVSNAFKLMNSPYAIIPGNHDMGPNGTASTRATLINEYFPVSEVEDWPTFGGAMIPGKINNTYHLFEVWGKEFIIIALEWGPTDAMVAWAQSILDANPTRYAILLTHTFLKDDNLRGDHTDGSTPQTWNPHTFATPGPPNDGEELWNELVDDNNFVLVVNGHELNDGLGYRVDTNTYGNDVHQMLVNYQMNPTGGAAYMRFLEFQPDGKTVKATSFTPFTEGFRTDPQNQFSFTMDLGQSDADSDGILDYHDHDLDNDGDGLSNHVEYNISRTMINDTDTDNDGVSDFDEVLNGDDPLHP